MVAIVSGNSLGLELGSLRTLDPGGVFGSAATGRSGEQVYVNAANGNLVIQDRDEVLAGRGDDAVLWRTYNSQGLLNDDNGDNWISGTVLQPLALAGTLGTAGSTLARTDKDGSSAVYSWDAARTAYVTREGDGACDTIVLAGGQLEWRDGTTGARQRYEASGAYRLLASIDTAGNSLTYGYNAAGRLASATTANGETTWYDYAGNNLAQVRTVRADATTTTRVRYGYDASNRLTTVTVDLTPDDNSIADGKTYQTSYSYDGASQRVASITQSDGTSLSIGYVSYGGLWRVASITNALGQVTQFSFSSGLLRVTDPLGVLIEYRSASGRLISIYNPRSGTEQRFDWNATGDLLRSMDPEGRATVYDYDANGNRRWERDDAGNTVDRTFDARDQLLTETRWLVADPDGGGPTLPSNPSTTRYAYEGSRNLLRFVVTAEGRVTEYRYNAFGQQVAEIGYTAGFYPVSGLAPDAAISESGLALWAAAQDASAAQRTDTTWDARGQMQARTTFARLDASGAGVVDGTQTVERFVHDQAGRLLQTISGTGATTVSTWDGLGRRLSTTDAAGKTQVVQYQDSARKIVLALGGGLVQTSLYDTAGQLVSVVDSNSAGILLGETRRFYDAVGNLRMTQDPAGVRRWLLYDTLGRQTGEVDGSGSLTESVFDKSGLVTKTIAYATPVNLAALVDAAGNVLATATIATVRPAGSAADRIEWRSYDSASRLQRSAKTIGNGSAVAVQDYRYDGASRLVETLRYANVVSTVVGPIAKPAASAADRSTRQLYDADGRLVGVLDPEGYLVETRYDAAGRPIERIAYATVVDPALRAAGVLAAIRPNPSADDQREVNWYDGTGRRIATLDAEGYVTETVFDADGNPTQVVRYANRVAGSPPPGAAYATVRPASSPADQATLRTHDGLGRVLQETLPGGIVNTYAYDADGRLVSTVRAAGSAESRTILARYDLQGRLTGELSAEGAALLTGGQTQAQVDAIWLQYGRSHTYDAAGRRTSSTDAAGNRTVSYYDADGELAVQVNAMGEVEETRRDTLGRVTDQVRYANRLAVTGLTGGVLTTAVAASLAALADAAQDSRTTTTWTRDDRQATVVDAIGNGTTSTYDAFGGEISRSQALGGGQTLVVSRTVDKRGLVTGTVTDATGVNAVVSTAYDAFGRVVRAVDANGNVRLQSWDRLGRSVTAIDPGGALRTTAYDAYGRVLTQTDPTGAVTTYAYDTAARRMTVTSPEGVVTTSTTSRHGQVVSVTDGTGQVTTTTYDRDGHLVRTQGPAGVTTATYDAAGRLQETTDGVGNKVAYGYDAASRVTSRTVDPGGLNLVTTWQVDSRGRRVSTTDPNGVVTTSEFDRKGQLVRQTIDPAGLNLQTRYTWDGAGRQLTVTSPGGTAVQTQYDNLGRRTRQVIDPAGLALTSTWAYDRNGNVVVATDPRGNVTRYAYDSSDRLLCTADPSGGVQQLVYDVAGRVVRTTSYATPIPLAGLAIPATAAAILARVVAQPLADVVEHRVYDRDSRVVATVDGTGAVVAFAYDGGGNVVRRTAYANRIALAGWAPGTLPAAAADPQHDLMTSTLYDAAGRAIYSVDAVGALVACSYDANGNLLQRRAYAAPVPAGTAATASALGAAAATLANASVDSWTRNVWDAAGRLTWSVEGTGAVTQRVYDKAGNIVRQVAYANALTPGAALSSVSASSATDRVLSMAYDTANRLVFQVDPLRAVVESACDANGNVVRRTAYATAISSVPALGLPGTAAAIRALLLPGSSDRTERYGYDKAGRQVIAVDAVGAVTQQAYDAAGAVAQVTARANLVNASGVPASPTLASLQALVTANASADRVARRAYDAAGRLVYDVDGMGAVSARSYDGVGRLLRITRHALTIGSAPTTTAAIAAALQVHAGDRTESSTYDAAGHRVSVTDAMGATESTTFDALGNRTTFTNKLGATWTYDNDAAGRVVAETSPLVDVTSVAADASGALVAGATVQARIVTRYSYDALGRLTSRAEAAGRAEQRVTAYEYDAMGRQLKVIHPAVGVYNAAADAVTTNGATGLATRVETAQALQSQTWYDVLGNALAGRDVGGSLNQKAYDLAGRVVYEVDALGRVTGYTRNAFGEVVALKRYGSATALANGNLTSATQAANKISVSSVVDAAGFDHGQDRVLLTSYDAAGRAIEVKEPTAFVYDPGATAAQVTAQAGKTTQTAYDAFGQAVQVRQLRNAALPGQATDVWAVTMHYFDRSGHEVATVDPLGYLTTREFDAVGNQTLEMEFATAIAAGGWNATTWTVPAPSTDDRTVRTGWDRLNRKATETRVGIEYSAAADGDSSRGDATTLHGYDSLGNETSVTDAMGNVTYTAYDTLGRIVMVAAPVRAGATAGTTLTPLTQFRRDAYGNVVAKTEFANGAQSAGAAGIAAGTADAADRTTRTRYDSFGRAVQVTDAAGASTWTSYDAWGHAAKTWQSVTDGDGLLRTVFQVNVYDQVGQLLETREPASTSVLRTGLTASVSVVPNDENGTPLEPHRVVLGWSTLVNPAGGTVRVQVDYTTAPTSGWTSLPASVTRDATAAAAAGGMEVTWWGPTLTVDTLRVLQWDGGQWATLWQGPPGTATGGAVATVTQAQAGLVTTAYEYNAFGELTRKGNQGGRQEYFDYDTAGRLWRSNAGDGVDRIQLFDLQGHATADIRSAGSGRDNVDVRGFADAQAAHASASTRRIDTTYDLLGHVTAQQLPVRLDSQGGGVSVQRTSIAAALVGNSAPAWNESSGFLGWIGTVAVDVGWSSLASLGPGDIKVTIDYFASVVTGGGGYDEASAPVPPVFGSGSLRSWTSAVLDGAGGATGLRATWTEAGAGPEGGLDKVVRILVQKKDLSGAWRTVIDQAPGLGSNSIDVAEPTDSRTAVVLELRTAGSAGATGWWPAPLVAFGNGRRFDTAALGTGSYEYRVKLLPPGQSERTIATGTVSLAAAPLASIGEAMSFGPAGTGVLAWAAQGPATSQVFRFRAAGSTGAWGTLAVTSRGAYEGVDTTTLTAGSYEFELLWTPSSGAAPASHATGHFTVTAATAAYWVPAVNLPPIAGFSLGTGMAGGTAYLDESGLPVYVGGTPVPALVWSAANATSVRYRVAGGNWSSLAIDNLLQTADESGVLQGFQKSLIQGLVPGAYQVEVVASTPQARQATGTLTIAAPIPGYYQMASVQVPTQQPIITSYAPVYETRYGTTQVAYSVWVNDPPVVTGDDESGSPIYAYPGHYETRYTTQTYAYQVQVGQTPVYATDENGNLLYQTVYVTQQQQVWVPGSTPAPTLVVTTPPYAPGYTVAARPAQYALSRDATPSSVAISGGGATVLGHAVATNDGDQWLRPAVLQKSDRWGNVLESTDPRFAGWKTTYAWNANNQMVGQTRPDASGGSSAASPVVRAYYDKLGRQVAARDANGNVEGQVLDSAGNLVQERHADTGVVTHRYDAFGDRVSTTDALGNVATHIYDRMGRRLSTTQGPVALYAVGASNYAAWQRTGSVVDSWTYDQLGRKLSQTNGNGETIRYGYDLRGNLLSTRQPLGQVLRATYDAQGRKTGEVDGNGYATTWTYDYFGRLIDHGDLGGAKSFYSYDNARQLVAQSSTRGQSITYGYDAAGQQTSIVDAANAKTSTYTYDLAGRRLREKVVQAGVTFQDNHLSYDAQGNLRDVADARVHIAMDYDAAGNRTRVATTVNYQGAGSEATESSERFFRYDAMNRQTVVDAVDAAGTAGRQTHRIGYDLNGNRVSDTAWSANRVLLASGQSVITGYGADGIAMYTANAATSTHGEGDSTEVYRYDALNRLQSVVRDGVQVDVRLYDGAGRVVQSGPTAGVPAAMASLVRDALEGAATGKDIRINRYDANGRMLHQKVLTDQGAARSDTSWDPDEWIGQAFSRQRAAGYDAAGNVLGYATASSEGDRTSNAYVNTLVRREGYLAQSTAGTSSQLPPGSSTQQYDANGFLVGYADSRQPANNRTFVNDAAGRALWVNQAGNVQRQLVVNGEVLGLYGAAVASTGAGGNPNFANLADFDFGYARISASYPNASPGAYQVRPGDTLQSIAQAAYGDGHLWFRIAEANGLASSTALKVGQTLNLPATVGMGRNDATTFKPYDPSRIRGDMTPVMAMPSGGDGCGSAGKLLMVVVAVAVTVSIGPESGSALEAWWAAALESSPALATAATAATASAAGSIVGQLVGLASGTVRSFNWNEVAQAGVSGGISAGLANGVLKGSDLMTSATRAAVANAMTQGIGVVTGLQQRFDWRGVAASAVGTLVGKGVEGTRGTPANAWAAVATRTLKGIAAGTVTAVARGGRVAIQQIAVDAFGSGLAESLVSSAHSPQEVFRSAEISDQNMTDRIETVLAKLHQSFVAKPMAPGTTSIANGGGGVGQILVASAALGEGIESFDNEVLARTLEFATLAPAPTLYKTATSSGHYYMIGAVGRSLGIPDAKLRRYMFYSQFPDQISAADGYTNGMRAFSMGLDYGPAKAGVIMMEAVHALNGRSTRENLITYQAIIDRFKTDDVVVGIALHALVDSVFHSKYDPSTGITVSFGSPAGHVREGSGQDYVSAKQVQVASAQVLIALETVAGLRLSAEQRQGAVNNVQMIIDRTHERTFEESSKMSRLGNFIGAMITVDERRDLNFRVVVEEMLGQGKEPPTWLLKPAPITNPIFGPMITAGQVNEQTRQFLNSRGAAFTLDEARVVAEEGMAGLERFVNAYRRDTNGGAPKADFQAAGLMDTRNWSLRKVPDRLAEVTFGTAWPMAGLLVGGALPFPIGKSLLDRVQGK